MFYNFYVYLVVIATLSPILAYNKQKILQKIDISEELFYTTSFILLYLIIFKKGNNKKIFTELDTDTLQRIVGQAFLVLLGLFISGYIINKENVFKYKLLQKPVYTIILLIIAVCFYKQKIDVEKIIGIIFILVGTYMVEKNIIMM